MRLLKISGRILFFLVLPLVLLLFSASIYFEKKAGSIIIPALNKTIPLRLEVGGFKLSFLRKFPRASIELQNVIVHSSPRFKIEGGKGSDTLLYAETIFLTLRIPDAIRGNYNIESLSAKNGIINLLTDKSGNINYDLSGSDGTPAGAVSIDLQKIILDRMEAKYSNLAKNMELSGLLQNGRLKSRIRGDKVDFAASGDLLFHKVSISGIENSLPFWSSIDLELRGDNKGITIDGGSLVIENNKLEVSGSVSSSGDPDLHISGNLSLGNFLKYLPAQYSGKAADYNADGKMAVDCIVKGMISPTRNPHVDIGFKLDGGKIINSKSGSQVENISFTGRFSNGAGNNQETSSLIIKEISLTLGESSLDGSISIFNFLRPRTDLDLAGTIFPSEIEAFFGLSGIEMAGSVKGDLRLSTDFWPPDSLKFKDLAQLNPEGSLMFDQFSFRNQDIDLSDITGSVKLSEVISASGLSFSLNNQKIGFSGEFRNLPDWLRGEPVNLIAAVDLTIDRFNPEKQFGSADKKEEKPFTFPPDMFLSINFNIGDFEFRKFSASQVEGRLDYKPGMAKFNSLRMNTLDGSVTGTGFLMQNPNGSYISRGTFGIDGLNIRKAFSAFNNFGQGFILADNLSGNLSGTISLLLPMNSSFQPSLNSISAEGKYLIEEGTLMDFEPVEQLSDFIEISELKNIQFEKLENDFLIRNNVFYIPQMDVKSSAADITVNGMHGFDNKYEYHVKVLLSQILSKKRKHKPVTEFGAVQDDGLGRTSLLLKIDNKNEDLRVGYDLRAAGQGIKNDIKAERKALKTIFKEEYGGNDKTLGTGDAPVKKKPKFSVTWENSDSIATDNHN